MTQETISEIIAVEKEIQARIGAEKDKIDQWLRAQEAEIAGQLELGLASLRQAQAEEEARLRARIDEENAALLAAAAREAKSCLNLAPSKLEDLIGRHLSAILPG